MDAAEISAAVEKLEDWSVSEDGKSIAKTYALADFAQALAFVNKIGDLAEKHDHHPDIALSWGKVGVTLSTHSEGGVTHKDIALAENIDQLGK